jgi:hypothetical protein
MTDENGVGCGRWQMLGWSEWKRKLVFSKMAAKLRDKRSINTMRVKNRAFAIFPPPVISHWSFPLIACYTTHHYTAFHSFPAINFNADFFLHFGNIVKNLES